jgi:protocatechuate 3,4-dioxygenase beta subunit
VDVVEEQTTTVNKTVQQAGGVGGAVTFDNGPVAGVWVDVYDSSGNAVDSTYTDDNGHYQVSGVTPGEVTICADPTYTAGGYERTCYGAQADGSGSPVTVSAAELSTADIQLRPGATITGTVTDASGAGVSGVLVSAFGVSSYNGYYAQTDESGSYSIIGVAGDDYRVCFDPTYAHGPSAGGYATQCYDNQPSAETADLVTVEKSGAVTVNAVLRSGAAITGHLTGSDGAPLQGAYIYAYGSEFGQQVTTTSDYGDGSYRISGLSESEYTLCFDAVDVQGPAATGYVNECFDNQPSSVGGTPVQVTGGAVTAGIDAELAVGAAITGRITDSAGNPLRYVFVDTYGADGADLHVHARGWPDNTGRYQVTGLPATAVALCFRPEDGANGPEYLAECYDDQPDVSTATPVNTTAGQVRSGVDAELAHVPGAG